VIVFGYPPDRYSATAEYFRSIGETTEPDPNVEITNCFRIGYANPAEAVRAVRKNGEVLGGSWMVGVKWAVSDRSNILVYERCS
jgi:nuclear pore complex protein Nup53